MTLLDLPVFRMLYAVAVIGLVALVTWYASEVNKRP